jgi:MYXO-CTERM domain-containing protein
VPSLSNLGDPENPVLLVTRPQRALDLTIGDNTLESPALTVDIEDFEVDIYVFVYERYVRAFTMRVDLAIGINAVFEHFDDAPPRVAPELVGLDADDVVIEVINSELLAESDADLEATLPAIFDLAVNLLGGAIQPIELPDLATFRLDDLRLQKVHTAEDDFLAIYASLTGTAALRALGERFPSIAAIAADLDASARRGVPTAAPAVTVVSVETPAPAEIRGALAGAAGQRLPTVTLAVPARDAEGHALEHAWRIRGGPWRPYRSGDRLVIADRAFAFQAAYRLEVRSRRAGDYTTTSEPTAVEVLIDSVAPEILADQAELDDLGLTVPARDLVSPASELRAAWGRPGDTDPSTDWSADTTIDRATLDDLVIAGRVTLWVRDEAGNLAVASVPVGFHGQAGEGGCGCAASGAPGGWLALLALVGLALRRRRRFVR